MHVVLRYFLKYRLNGSTLNLFNLPLFNFTQLEGGNASRPKRPLLPLWQLKLVLQCARYRWDQPNVSKLCMHIS